MLQVDPIILLISQDYTKIVSGLTYVSVSRSRISFNTVYFSCLITQLEGEGPGLGNDCKPAVNQCLWSVQERPICHTGIDGRAGSLGLVKPAGGGQVHRRVVRGKVS